MYNNLAVLVVMLIWLKGCPKLLFKCNWRIFFMLKKGCENVEKFCVVSLVANCVLNVMILLLFVLKIKLGLSFSHFPVNLSTHFKLILLAVFLKIF